MSISDSVVQVQNIVKRLTEENQWQYFLHIFNDMEKDILEDMRSGHIKTLDKLLECNGKLELITQLKEIQNYKRGGK